MVKGICNAARSGLPALLAVLVTSGIGVATPAAAQDDEGFVSQDQSGNDPREFSSKFMPYYRFTELDNDLQVNEYVLFGFQAFTGRIGMTYELPLGKKVDYGQVDGFQQATAAGCPPPTDDPTLPPIGPLPGGGGGIPIRDLDWDGDEIGFGDTILLFFLLPQDLEFFFGKDK